MTLPRGLVSYSYAAATGSLSNITAPDGGTLSFTFDGFLPTSTTWAGQVTGTVSNVYDNNFRVTSLKINGNPWNFTYDNDGLLTKYGVLNLIRDAQNGLLTGTTLGNVADTITYNTFGETNTYDAAWSGSNIFSTQYTRDDLGRIISKVETVNGVTSTYDYAYDTAGRLAQVTKDGAVTSDYGYDANSNKENGVTSRQMTN